MTDWATVMAGVTVTSKTSQAASAVKTIGTIAHTTNGHAFMGVVCANDDGWTAGTVPAGWTKNTDYNSSGTDPGPFGPKHPHVVIANTPVPTGDIVAQVTCTHANTWGGVGFSIPNTAIIQQMDTEASGWPTFASPVTAGSLLVTIMARRDNGVDTYLKVNNIGGRSITFTQLARVDAQTERSDDLFAGWITAVGDEQTLYSDHNGWIAIFEIRSCYAPIAFDVHSLGDATTPALTYLATLCDAFDKSFRVELDGTGSGQFSINRSSADATAAILGDGDGDVRYVQVRISDIDAAAIFGFFIEEGDFRLLDENEDGGETLTFSGHGSLAYLDFAVQAAHSYITNGMDPFGGLWRLYLAGTGSKPGQMLNRVITEAQDSDRPQKPLPLLTDTFDYTNDSNAAAWASSSATNEFAAQIGESVLSVVGRLIGTGAITVQMSPALVLSAYNTFGTNRSNATFAAGKIRFVGGTNIAEGLTRQVRPTRVATHALVYGEEEKSVIAALADAATRVTREVFLSAAGTTTAALTAIGSADLDERLLRSESISFRIALGANDATGLYLPGPAGSTAGKFWVGDTVTLHTGSGEFDFTNQSIVVAAINIIEGNAVAAVTDLEVRVELGSTALAPSAGSAGGGSVGLTPGPGGLPASPGGGSSITPFHTHPTALAGVSSWKDPVRAASTGTLTISAPGATIDGVTMVAQDRFLAKDQTAGAENGIYIWLGAAVAATRAADFASGSMALGATAMVSEGTVNADTVWRGTTNETITLGTTVLVFANATAPTGPAGGDLSGTYPNPTIVPAAVRDAGRWEPVVDLASAIVPDFVLGLDGDIAMGWVPAGTAPSHPARTGMTTAAWLHNIEALGDIPLGLAEL